MTETDRRIAAIAVGQLGTFTRAQALDVGLSNRQLRSRVRSGILQQTGPNAFRVAGTPTTARSRLAALVLDVGDPVVAAGPTAAAVHRIDGFELTEPYHLLVPADRNVRRNRAVIHRTERFARIDRCVVDGVPTTCHFPGVGLVVELMGYRFHRTRSQMNRDAERHNALLAAGQRVLQFTDDQVTTGPDAVVQQTLDALRRHAA